MISILLGPPGSGKGTQAEIVKNNYNLFQIATGNLLRNKMTKNTPSSKKIREMMGTGELFPDEIINKLVAEEIEKLSKKENYRGLLFDGYPRTINQAIFLDDILEKNNLKLDCVLVFSIPDELIIDRITARRVDKKTGKVYNLIFNPPAPDEEVDLFQRIDDTEEIMKTRLEVYRKQTEPLISYYSKREIVEIVDTSSADMRANSKNILDALDKYEHLIIEREY